MAPASITIIRHAEKPDETGKHAAHGVDEQGDQRATSLTVTGWRRAGAWTLTLGGPTVPAPLIRPTAIVTPDYGAQTPYHRPTQTVAALAQRLGVTPLTPVPKGDESELAALLLEMSGDVLVCWEHHHIPAIVAALAAPLGLGPLPPLAQQWPDDDFSSVLIITVARSGPSSLTVAEQP